MLFAFGLEILNVKVSSHQVCRTRKLMQVHLQEGQRERLKSVNDTGLCMIQANSGQKSLGGRTHLGAFE